MTGQMHAGMRSVYVAGIILFTKMLLCAQPSGGPYGPVQQAYEIPENAKTVYYVAPDGNDTADGRTVDSPMAIETAVRQAGSGDVIVLRGGVYRTGDLVFNQNITLQPYRDEQPVFKGTRITGEWEQLPGNLWRTKWKTLFPLQPQPWWSKARNIRNTPVYMFNNDMVFVDGRPLATKGYPAELDETSFCVDYEDGYIYIGSDPAGHTIEITVYDNALTRTVEKVNDREPDSIGPVIRGIIFTQYAYRAIEIEGYDPEGISPEQEHGKDIVGTIIEHCTLSHCSRVGAYLRGDNMVIRHNLISDTGTEGLFILASNDVLLERNIVTRNNMEEITGYFPTAIKIFNQCRRVTCNDNLIIDNRGESSGIWYDVGNVDSVCINNWVERTDNGFFLEISKGAVCAGNVFVNCKTGTKVLNSSGAKIYQNTYVNSRASFERTNRGAEADHFGWHPRTGPAVEERHGHEFGNNLIVVNPLFESPLLHVRQHPDLKDKLTEPMFDYADRNIYVRGTAAGPMRGTSDNAGRQSGGSALIAWAPLPTEGGEGNQRFDSLEAFQARNLGFEGNSLYLAGYNGPLFEGRWLGNYALRPEFSSRMKGAPLPERVRVVLSDVYETAGCPGAYPAARNNGINKSSEREIQ